MVLREKQWFLTKRCQRLCQSSGESVQKKPTAANRLRLEQAIRDAIEHLPRVYRDSTALPEELSKPPVVGEREMAEQAESLNVTGSMHTPEAAFVMLMACGVSEGGDLGTAAPLLAGQHEVRGGPAGRGTRGATTGGDRSGAV